MTFLSFTFVSPKNVTPMSSSRLSLKVRLILFNQGKILLLKQTKLNGGNYTLVGGNVDTGETSKEALVRECKEEAGITIVESDLRLVHVLQKTGAKTQRMVLYFKAFRWEGELQRNEPLKFRAAEWHDLHKLPKNLTGTIKKVLKDYKEGILFTEKKQLPK
jgi:ADP-ribose pyrophosphatase YjhB (NUDIX family)